jgi:poly-beta-1,6-N-acetyl-D-glucosamine synthase
VNGRYMRAHQRLEEVAGAVQFFRRDCFEAIGGLMPMREGGWDAITCISARMHGYKTATFADLTVEHLKPRNASEGNPVRRKWQMGLRDYALGNHPLFETMKCVGRWSESPLFLGAAARFIGYCWGGVVRRGRVLPREIVAYSRREQVARLKSVLPW